MKPLAGLKVVELASFIAAPSAARMMSEWGADVIKIEPLEGDYYRNFGITVMLPATADVNPVYTTLNSGKKLVCLNMKSKEGIEAVYKLLADADVFITNIRYKSVQKMGLGYDALKDKFPKLVYFQFDGFGKKGPDADRAGFDAAAFWAASGITGDWATKGEHPLRPGHGFGDAVTSFNITSGILAAVYQQKMTGKGCFVSTSLFATALWGNQVALLTAGGPTQTIEYPREEDSENHPFINCYQCADGRWILWYCQITKINDCYRAIEREDLVDKPGYTDRAGIRSHKKELFKIVTEQVKKHDSTYWDELLTKLDIIHSKLPTTKEVTESPQAWANEYFQKVKYPDGSEYITPAPPMEFGEDYKRDEIKPCGPQGTNTREVLLSVGYTDEEIDSLVAAGAIKA